MEYFICLTSIYDDEEDPYIYIALNKISSFYKGEKSTKIRTVDGMKFNVKETPKEINEIISYIYRKER